MVAAVVVVVAAAVVVAAVEVVAAAARTCLREAPGNLTDERTSAMLPGSSVPRYSLARAECIATTTFEQYHPEAIPPRHLPSG